MLDHIFMDGALLGTAIIAGFVDTLAGGGGLLTIPVLLLSGLDPLTALGTNKLQSATGEFSAMWHFMRSKKISYGVLKLCLIYTLIGSAAGTLCVQYIPLDHLGKMVPVLLLLVLFYFIYHTFSKKKGPGHAGHILIPDHQAFFALGSVIGFYNGFFGPGTGSMWAVSLMHKFKLGLKEATMYAKPLNMIGNLTALMIFIITGKVDYFIAIMMGIGSFIGARLGAHFVMYKSLKWLKILFFSLMLASIIATFRKYY